MRFDALLPLTFFLTMNKFLRILFSENRWNNHIYPTTTQYEHFSYPLTHVNFSFPNEFYREIFGLPHFLHRLKGILFQYWLKPRAFVQQLKVNNQSPNSHTRYIPVLFPQFALPLKLKPHREDTIATWSVIYSLIQLGTNTFKRSQFLFTVLSSLLALWCLQWIYAKFTNDKSNNI